MDQVDERSVTALGRRVVEDSAPEELPMFSAMSREFVERGIRLDRAGRDVFLGFGIETAVALVTPAALELCRLVWESLRKEVTDATAEAAREGAGELLRRLRARFGAGDEDSPEVSFTPEQLVRVRERALRHAGALGLPEEQQRLLAEAIVGALVTPDSDA